MSCATRITASSDTPGYRLWLAYAPPSDLRLLANYRSCIRAVVLPGDSSVLAAARRELHAGLSAMLNQELAFPDKLKAGISLLIGTPRSLPGIDRLVSAGELESLGSDGFVIRTTERTDGASIVIASAGDVGIFYGVFHFLRLLQTGQPIHPLAITQKPKLRLRVLDHWDNLDGSIERGYAGRSLWRWDELPDPLDPRYTDYARACASIGINGSVLNNVNANPRFLSSEYLRKAAALAEVFRGYGIRVYLSANFAAPMTLGGLATADPLDPGVARWWRAKADEIYRLIPDFGGLVVKANSEGQPGPQDYRRTHADGANVLANALAPHGGIVMWRAFVYNEFVDPDRAKRAYIEFTALDGQFRENVIVQVKNGPIDFQPREPFHPLFGAMKHTPVMAELQITQEYLGHSNHLVYLATMWKEFLDSDTHTRGPGTSVAKTIDGLCAVANTGSDANWCGHHFAAANWYAFGRLAWDPDLSAEQIADEWIRMTWSNATTPSPGIPGEGRGEGSSPCTGASALRGGTLTLTLPRSTGGGDKRDPEVVEVLKRLMLDSWETFISYSMPLGLHHLIGGNHYAPMPWNDTEPREDWTATYYHRADHDRVGFDRTMRGNGAVGQYAPAARDRFDSLDTCPEELLLWFHRLPWDHRMRSGRTLWEEIVAHYRDGAAAAEAMRVVWQSLAGKLDAQRHSAVAEKLATQARDAAEWRDRCIEYFDRVRQHQLKASSAK